MDNDFTRMKARYMERMVQLWPSVPCGDGFFISSPGRVNLIGEHIDYNNCPVLPFAVDKRILAYVVPLDEQVVKVADVHPEYGDIEFPFPGSSDGERNIPAYTTGHWGNYIKAAVQQLLFADIEGESLIATKGKPSKQYFWRKGFAMVMGSTIPQAAGMSSSSAIVVLGAIAMLKSNRIEYAFEQQRYVLADICRIAERYVGTIGGGMDQTAILMGKSGHAIKISFNPLGVEYHRLPAGYSIVVADSLVKAPKTRQMLLAYNRRSIECSLATAVISTRLEQDHGIGGIEYIGDLTPAKTNVAFGELESLVNGMLHEDPYRIEELVKLLDIDDTVFQSRYLRMKDGSLFPSPDEGFKLYQRFLHVWNEWKRVELAVKALEDEDPTKLGALMNASHFSCRDLMEISCSELDELTSLARNQGATGSRLTGAGFGGCTVNLVPDPLVPSFLQGLEHSYYRDRLPKDSEIEQHLFVVQPSDGVSPW